MFYISGKSRLTTAQYSDILKEIIFSPKVWSQKTWIQIPTAPLVSYWSYQAFYPSVSFCKMRIIIVSILVDVSIVWNNVKKIPSIVSKIIKNSIKSNHTGVMKVDHKDLIKRGPHRFPHSVLYLLLIEHSSYGTAVSHYHVKNSWIEIVV